MARTEGSESSLVTYDLDGSIAWIRIDDGPVNALSPRMIARSVAPSIERAGRRSGRAQGRAHACRAGSRVAMGSRAAVAQRSVLALAGLVAVAFAANMSACSKSEPTPEKRAKVERAIAKRDDYIRRSENLEAKINLGALARGAESWFHEEHVDPEGLGLMPPGFPHAPQPVCSAGGGDCDALHTPTEAEWDAAPWPALRFAVLEPYRFRYCYASSEDGAAFAAWADVEDARFCVGGRGLDGLTVSVTDVVSVGTDTPCSPQQPP